MRGEVRFVDVEGECREVKTQLMDAQSMSALTQEKRWIRYDPMSRKRIGCGYRKWHHQGNELSAAIQSCLAEYEEGGEEIAWSLRSMDKCQCDLRLGHGRRIS